MRRLLLAAIALLTVGLLTPTSTATPIATPTPTATPTATPTPTPDRGTNHPVSFTNGPLGSRNPLPPKDPGAFIGIWGPGADDGTVSWAQTQQGIAEREAFAGRQFDWIATHYAAPSDRCHWGTGYRPFAEGREQWIHDRGQIPVVNWTHGWTAAATNAGLADACIREVARYAAALQFPMLLRIYWEFDGTWFRWSSYGQQFIDMWRRTVDLFKAEGANNVGFVWSPGPYRRDRVPLSYPGDEYVDWVGISTYNWFKPDAWCAPWPIIPSGGMWCDFALMTSHDPVNAPMTYDQFADRKPYGSFETGSREDEATRGHKGQWFRNLRDEVPLKVPKVRGIVYFDMNMTADVNWRLDTSQSSHEGWRDLVQSPFFRTG